MPEALEVTFLYVTRNHYLNLFIYFGLCRYYFEYELINWLSQEEKKITQLDNHRSWWRSIIIPSTNTWRCHGRRRQAAPRPIATISTTISLICQRCLRGHLHQRLHLDLNHRFVLAYFRFGDTWNHTKKSETLALWHGILLWVFKVRGKYEYPITT
jgi:hypothetical protein